MPVTNINRREIIEIQYQLIKELEEKCENCKYLNAEREEMLYTYSIEGKCYGFPNKPAMVAIAQYTDAYAIHVPKYFKEQQWTIFDSFLVEVESSEKIIVFSKEVFENIEKHSYGRKLNIILDV